LEFDLYFLYLVLLKVPTCPSTYLDCITMGGSVSSTEVENTVKTALGIELSNQIENSCSALADTSQSFVIRNTNGGHFENITQESFYENTCKISSAIEALQDIQGSQEIIQQLEKAQDTSGLFAVSVDTSKITNNSSLDIDIAVLNQIKNECRSNFTAPQTIEITDSSDIYVKNLTQTNNMYNKCIQGTELFQELKTTLDNKLTSDISLTQKTVGLDIAGILGALLMPLILIVGIVIFISIGSGDGSDGRYGRNPDGSFKSGGSSTGLWIFLLLVVAATAGIGFYLYNTGYFEETLEPQKCAGADGQECGSGSKCVHNPDFPDNPDKGMCKCKGNWEGAFCTDCKYGYAGKDCEKCDSDAGFTGDDCTECKVGYKKQGLACVLISEANSTLENSV